MTELNNQKASVEHKRAVNRDNSAELKKRIEASKISVSAKCGENGKLFGAVTSMDIEKAVKQQLGIEVEKRKIVLPEGIKSTGEYTVTVKLFEDISAELKIEIKGL